MLFFCLGGSTSIVRKLIIKVKQKYQSLMKRWTKPSNCVGQFTPLLSWNEKDQIMFNLFQKQKEKQKKCFRNKKKNIWSKAKQRRAVNQPTFVICSKSCILKAIQLIVFVYYNT